MDITECGDGINRDFDEREAQAALAASNGSGREATHHPVCPHCGQPVKVHLQLLSDGETTWAKVVRLSRPDESGPARPGSIEKLDDWQARCHICEWYCRMPSYQDASIQLTGHLEEKHKGWELKAPNAPGEPRRETKL